MISSKQVAYKRILTSSSLKAFRASFVAIRANSTANDTGNVTVTASKPKQEAITAGTSIPVNKKKNQKAFKPMNSKLRDISFQIKKEVDNPESNLNESYEMLEEGLSYLNGIKVAENIEGEVMFSIFQPIVSALLKRSLKENASQNERTPDEILDMLINYNVAHSYHFLKLMAYELANNDDKKSAYQKAMGYWIKFIEYKSTSANPHVYKIFKFMREDGYNQYDIRNLAFFSYVSLCISENLSYDFKDALKILQSEELPEGFQIRKTLLNLKLADKLNEDYREFDKRLKDFNLSSFDPNGNTVTLKINQAVRSGDANAIDKLYSQIKEASLKNKIPINETTLVKLMNGYYDCGAHSRVFQIFYEMLQNGIEKPSTGAWDFVIRSMAHPSYIRDIGESGKEELILTIERLVQTFLASGTELNAKTLAIIIGAYANLDKFDVVEDLLKKYTTEGDGILPVIQTTKNNILIGMVLNGKVTEAESKLQEYMKNDPQYIPSSTVMNTFVSVYIKMKNFKAIDGIISFMNDNDVPVEVGTYTTMIDLFFKLHREKGLVPNIEDLFTNLNIKKSKFNDFTMTALVDGLVKDGINLEAGRTIFEHISKTKAPSAQLITAIIKSEIEFGSMNKAEELFEKYLKTVRNDPRIWNMLIKPLLERDEQAALNYYMRFKEQAKSGSSEPNFYTYYFLLSHYLKRGNGEKVQFIIDELADKSASDLGRELPRLLKPLMKNYVFSENLIKTLS